jgi:hypothetical protein
MLWRTHLLLYDDGQRRAINRRKTSNRTVRRYPITRIHGVHAFRGQISGESRMSRMMVDIVGRYSHGAVIAQVSGDPPHRESPPAIEQATRTLCVIQTLPDDGTDGLFLTCQSSLVTSFYWRTYHGGSTHCTNVPIHSTNTNV